MIDNDSNSVVPITRRELLIAIALFTLPTIPSSLTLIFGYQPAINRLISAIYLTLMAFIVIVIIKGLFKGFPRWSVPFLGILITAIVLLEPSWRIWELFYQPVQQAIGYNTKTLEVRLLYSTLQTGFFWFTVFIAATILVLLLAIWSHTRHLAKSIYQDWTVFSFMLYGGIVFALQLVFEEYIHDEPWKIICWTCLALGAWFYMKGNSTRQRIQSLLIGVTLIYWIAAIGKWILVPIQTWGAFHGYQYEFYRWFEFWRTLGEWGWVLLFMSIPALLSLIPKSQKIVFTTDEGIILT